MRRALRLRREECRFVACRWEPDPSSLYPTESKRRPHIGPPSFSLEFLPAMTFIYRFFSQKKGNNIEKTGFPNLLPFCMYQIQPSTMPFSLPSDSTTKGNVHLPTISSPIHLLTVHLFQCIMPTRGRWRSRIRIGRHNPGKPYTTVISLVRN